jgi:uncharacterized protein (TIGR02118 family)
MVSYFVSYRGDAPDREAFLRHYGERHARVLAGFPGIRSLVLHTATDCADPFPVNPGGRLLLAQMGFDSTEALNVALASEARARAREDFRGFPPFQGEITHQAMTSRKVF